MKKRWFALGLGLVISFSFILGGCGSSSSSSSTPTPPPPGPSTPNDGFAEKPEVTLILTNQDPDTAQSGVFCHAWADMVFEKSKGRIKVEVNNGASLAGPTESLDKVKAGSVDIAQGLPSFYPGQFVMTDGLSMPYLPYKSSAHASHVFWEIFSNTDLIKNDPGYAGTKVIKIYANNDAQIVTAKKKLEKAEDLKGMTIRASAKTLVDWLAKLDATGKPCPINDLYQNLQNGAFDGAITDWNAHRSFMLYDNCAKYFADEYVQFNTYFFLMNEKKYNSLSPELKAIIDDCSDWNAVALNLHWADEFKLRCMEIVTEAGCEIYTLPEAEHQKLVDAANESNAEWVKENNAQELYDTLIKTINDTADMFERI